jgi:DNA-binding protein HU-beta
VNKSELTAAVAKELGCTKSDASKAVDAVFGVIKKALKSGDKVALVGMATFGIRKVPAKTVRNPRTGEPVQVKASNRVVFRAGKELKEAVNS